MAVKYGGTNIHNLQYNGNRPIGVYLSNNTTVNYTFYPTNSLFVISHSIPFSTFTKNGTQLFTELGKTWYSTNLSAYPYDTLPSTGLCLGGTTFTFNIIGSALFKMYFFLTGGSSSIYKTTLDDIGHNRLTNYTNSRISTIPPLNSYYFNNGYHSLKSTSSSSTSRIGGWIYYYELTEGRYQVREMIGVITGLGYPYSHFPSTYGQWFAYNENVVGQSFWD